MHKGLLKSWKTDKGFGFIKSDTLEHDTFIHISALKHMSRKPKVGDTIYFEIATQPDGKTKAINCRIEGVTELKAPYQKHKQQPHSIAKSNFASSFLGKVASIALIAALCFYAFNKYNAHSNSQMTSKDEAIFFINNCPNTKMDGDRDGKPCESDSRFKNEW